MFEAGQAVGRRFFLVSFVPTLVGVLFAAGIVSSGAFVGGPQWSDTTERAASLNLADLSALLLVTLVLALLSHPFQTNLVKSVEGYDEGGLLPRTLLDLGRARQERRVLRLEQHTRALRQAEQRAHSPFDREPDVRRLLARADGRVGEFRRDLEAAREVLPKRGRLLASRLGNTLRYWEDFAGERYGLSAVLLSPHFAAVSPSISPKMEDARNAMDRNLRFCVVFVGLTVLALFAYLNDGPYLLVAVAFSLASYVWYAGALRASATYGDLAAVNVDLHRFEVLKAMGYPAPSDPLEEKRLFEVLGRQVLGKLTIDDVRYLRGRLDAASRP